MLLLLSDSPAIHCYSTDIGEQLPVYLSGAQLTLNTDTRLLVRQAQNILDIQLLQGEVLLRIEHRPQRQVEVLAANARISDIGTTFDVHVTDDKVTVTVVDGLLDLSPVDETIARITLRQGERGEISRLGGARFLTISELSINRINRELAWEHGELIFDANSVAEIARQFNRYNRHPQIEIQSPEIAFYEMSGIFSVHDPRAFVSALQHIDPNVHLQFVQAPDADILLGLSY